MCKSQTSNVKSDMVLRAANERALLKYIIEGFYTSQVVHQAYA